MYIQIYVFICIYKFIHIYVYTYLFIISFLTWLFCREDTWKPRNIERRWWTRNETNKIKEIKNTYLCISTFGFIHIHMYILYSWNQEGLLWICQLVVRNKIRGYSSIHIPLKYQFIMRLLNFFAHTYKWIKWVYIFILASYKYPYFANI
jgi:hypothetical protein